MNETALDGIQILLFLIFVIFIGSLLVGGFTIIARYVAKLIRDILGR